MNYYSVIKSKLGFSLIELVVVVGILLLLSGGGIVAFFDFNEKQQLINAGKELKEHLRTAQTLARIGETPEGCIKLNGYNVSSSDGAEGKEISLKAVCSSGDIERNNFVLPVTTTLSDDIDITFWGLYGGVSGATTIEVVVDSGRTFTFAVTPGGEITEGEVE